MYDTKKYAKTYRQKHKEEIKAYAKAYRQEHKEEIKACRKAWWEKNKHFYKYERKDSKEWKGTVTSICYEFNERSYGISFDDGDFAMFEEEDVFPTRKEAEAKLKESESK